MIIETMFNKIIRHEVPADIIYQDDLVTAFKDIKPQAPIHILIIPNISISTINHVKPKHEQILGRMITTAAKIAKQKGIADSGYRLVMNCNKDSGQEIPYIHMHLIGGCFLGDFLQKK